ncbi:MAG: Fe2+ or Zn2+ uptake regulation protein [Saprospiraceae bacterium]|jgi:Fe2+ or Zn2+ uptake regulation protein
MRQTKKSIQVTKSIVSILGRMQRAMSADEIYFTMLDEDLRSSISTVYVNLNKLFANDSIQVVDNYRAKRYRLKS